ncbi:MAG: right-handed parallel beta-helix repeat-containing protein [Thermaurantiacus tibetensis]|uniref:right-handed parallel beta-helix repeat-containing protein n=1 Tax=Thermaurantiacus tibetensis TaxID=2759035 RepID=UPI00188DE236|nr:right-handed parallel beta-helix repeat-containing protein [Thermaurantiacus tibetensis]
MPHRFVSLPCAGEPCALPAGAARPGMPAGHAVRLSRRAFVGSGLALAAAPGTAAGNASGPITVSTAAELVSAARAAAPGATILVNPGNYGPVNFSGIAKSGSGILIRPAGTTRPSFTALGLRDSAGIAIVNMNVVGTSHPLVNVYNASDIRLGGLRIGGTPNLDPWDDANTGLWVRFSSRVTVSNCRFQDLRVAAYLQRSQGVIVADCTFQYVREGLNACAIDRLLLRRNRFQLILPNYALGEHPDAVQFWMSGETQGLRDVVIAENFLPLGDQRPVQGLFLTAGYIPPEARGTMFHEHVEVRDNIYYGSSGHGITLSWARNALVWKNSIVASPHADTNAVVNDPAGRTGSGFQPQLRLWETNGVRVERNISTFFNLPATGVTQARNLKIWDSQTRTGEPVAAVFGARPTASLPNLSEFRVRPGSVAAGLGAGATPPSRAGATSLSNEAAAADVEAYHATQDRFSQWFSPGF